MACLSYLHHTLLWISSLLVASGLIHKATLELAYSNADDIITCLCSDYRVTAQWKCQTTHIDMHYKHKAELKQLHYHSALR